MGLAGVGLDWRGSERGGLEAAGSLSPLVVVLLAKLCLCPGSCLAIGGEGWEGGESAGWKESANETMPTGHGKRKFREKDFAPRQEHYCDAAGAINNAKCCRGRRNK